MDFSFLLFGFLTGLSFILAVGPQNLFVIEQGLKNQFVFIICLICSLSDLILIFIGILLFHYLDDLLTQTVENILSILLILFLINFIKSKYKSNILKHDFSFEENSNNFKPILFKVLGFTFLNPHVYSDTVFVLGNLSKNFHIFQKVSFGIGASLSSFIFFFLIGYLSKYFSIYLKKQFIWKILNLFIIFFMSFIIILVLLDMINSNF
tara:strand:+ start:106 stop:729 length:624 start_codon:yes stop_codon:yes gene_type:complete